MNKPTLHKPTFSKVKELKALFVRSILRRMNSEKGHDFVAWNRNEKESFVFTVTSKDGYGREVLDIPVSYHAGIDDGATMLRTTRVALASEEAKRRIRDLFPGHEKFVTWAYYLQKVTS